jgi:ubiquinone/menaquinone biosynthesis C-methylase UbiE
MLIKFIGIVLVIIGLAGLALPILPGIILITIGVLLLFNDRLADIRRLLPEKMPMAAALIYSWLVPKIMSSVYKIIVDEIHLVEGQALLYIGTGPGILPIQIAKRFPHSKIVGIDLSEKMIEIALENRVKGLDNLEFKVMDAKVLEFQNSSFDIIISTGSLHHWKEPVRILDEIYRCLKSGGEAYVYDGYANAADEDIDKGVKRIWNIFPPRRLIRYMLNIHGYTEKEYNTLIKDMVGKSRFQSASFEKRGAMMMMRFKKLSA